MSPSSIMMMMLLKCLEGQHKISKRHSKWIKFLEQFPYVIKHKQGKVNIVADALSRRHTLLTMLEAKLLGFEILKDLYMDDNDFKEAYDHCVVSANVGFFRNEGFLFKEKKLYVSKSFIRELLVKEAHKGGSIGHFGDLVEHFYWPKMKSNVHHVYKRFLTCKITKLRASSKDLYASLPIPLLPRSIFLWTLCLDCHGHKKGEIQYLL
ncbi:hypothetical protein CR513_10944, partial [Mucuna pruriens]